MADSIVKTVELKAPVERVWRAITDHEEFGRWFRVRIDQPFALGAPSTGRITSAGYEYYKWEATVTAMEPMRRFAYTWPHPADPHAETYAGEPRTLVEFVLEPMAEGTRLTITESGFDALPADRREERMRENTGGWDQQARNIKAHVEA